MSTLVCSDLDRTLIYSAAALGLTVPDADAPRLLCVEVYRGAPLSFVTEAAAVGIVALAGEATLVPTTTRTPEQLARVHLPGPPARYAIAANGGRLLVDGRVDEDWSRAVAATLVGTAAVAEVHEHLARPQPFLRTVRTASDLFAYAVVDRDEVPPAWVEELTGWCRDRGWGVSVQGRKVYAVPDGLTKSAAAAEVARRAGTTRLLAAGDSLLDADLLLAADAAVRPAHGELHDAGFAAPHVAVTTSAGVAAGVDVVRWFRAHLDPR
ncbi:hypothetical protein GCM10027047_06460 [Rhodococcus aerolatus]